MGYYIRVLATSLVAPSLAEIRKAAEPAIIECDDEDGHEWNTFVLKHQDEIAIALIERNSVIPGELGADEIEEFLDEVAECKPASGAAWLAKYLPTVKVIYAFQLLSGTDVHDGYERMTAVRNLIWNAAGGIFQADGEGFSDEDGYTILWQFSDHVDGSWNVGVLSSEGKWIHFEMELGNKLQREAFWRGEVPAGVKLA